MAAPGAFRSTIVLDARQRVGQRARFTGTVRVDSVHADPPSPSPWLARRRRRTVGRTAAAGVSPCLPAGVSLLPCPFSQAWEKGTARAAGAPRRSGMGAGNYLSAIGAATISSASRGRPAPGNLVKPPRCQDDAVLPPFSEKGNKRRVLPWEDSPLAERGGPCRGRTPLTGTRGVFLCPRGPSTEGKQ